MNISESIILAIDSVRVNKLRAFLSLLSIAIGVFAIIGAFTLTNSINNAVTNEMAAMGENTFIIKRLPTIMTGDAWFKLRHRKNISLAQYKELKRTLTTSQLVSAQSSSSANQVKAGDLSTDPDVTLIGTDENYYSNNNITIAEGRPFSVEDLLLNRNVAVIGNDVKVKLFPGAINALGKRVTIKNQSFEVVGVLEVKGAMMGQSQDNEVIIPVTQLLKYYSNEWEESLNLTIKADSKAALSETMDETVGLMRSIRGCKPWEDNSFEVETNESIGEQFSHFTIYLSVFGAICGTIALIAAGVGIMNIMLVSVKERTREIGIRKAIGARKSWITTQFLVETITLCQIGGLAGISIGLLGSWVLSSMMGIKIVFPLGVIFLSVIFCTVLGLVAGAYPAFKAAKLDPIEALRYE